MFLRCSNMAFPLKSPWHAAANTNRTPLSRLRRLLRFRRATGAFRSARQAGRRRAVCRRRTAFYLQAFKGFGSYDYDRIGRGHLHIIECTLSIIGGIQPSRISPLVRGATTGVRDDGLVPRFQLPVWPDDIPTWKWVNQRPNTDAKNRYEAVFCKLHEFARSLGVLQYYTFSNDAQDMFQQWNEEIMTESRTPTWRRFFRATFKRCRRRLRPWR